METPLKGPKAEWGGLMKQEAGKKMMVEEKYRGQGEEGFQSETWC